MKQILKLSLLLLAILLPATATAYDFIVNGIGYSIIDNDEAEVTYVSFNYSGVVVIPEIVTNNGTTYTVTAIGNSAIHYGSWLTSITMPNTITSIGNSAFNGCSGLTSITIPNSVTSIGSAAFSGCTKLSSISIPNSVSVIGSSAFNGTPWYNQQPDGLVYAGLVAYKYKGTMPNGTTIVIEDGSTGIAGSAFYGCTGLTGIDIPNSVTDIGSEAFRGCIKLTSIDLPNSIATISISTFYGCSGLTSITIPNSVTSIESAAFSNCIELTSIFIPNSVSVIGSSAFKDCTNLESIIIPNSNISIGYDAFKGTAWFNNQPDGLVYIGLIVYKYKGTMPDGTSIIIDDGTLGIADEAFWECSGLTSIEIPNSIKTIGSYAFCRCSGLTSINIPNSITSIGKGTFSSCTGLTSISIPNSIITIAPNLFYYCTGLTSITISNSITSIGSSAFEGCSGLTSINLPSSISSIGSSAFNGCSGLSSITIPNSVTSIGNDAFSGCTGLTNVTIPNSVTTIGSYAFGGCTGLTNVNIPNSLTTISNSLFYGCSSLTSISIPSSVTSIGYNSFNYCGSLAEIRVMSGNPKYDSRENCNAIIETNSNKLIIGCNNTTIPNTVTSISGTAFWGCSGLTNIIIPKSLTGSILDDSYNNPFTDCSGLTNIIVAEDNPTYDSRNNCNAIIKKSNNELIVGCKNSFIPNTVTAIAPLAFYRISGLTSITIPNSVTAIGFGAFGECTGLTSIEIPNSVTLIDIGAFADCSSLESAIIGNSVTGIYNSFDRCINLSTVICKCPTPPNAYWYYSALDYPNPSLYVPQSSVEAYRTAEEWCQFQTILPIEGFFVYDYFSMDSTTALYGDTIVIPVKMTNEADIISFQTDIFLPEGLVLLQEDDEYIIEPSARMTNTHSISSNDVSNGAIRVLCYSSNYKPFTGESGDDLFYLTVKVADDAEGDYSIILKNTLLTTSDFEEIEATDIVANVHVNPYLLGDANNSRTVTITDVVVTSQYVLEMNPQPFVFEAADVNIDGSITVTDVSRIAWMVLNPDEANAPLRAPALWNNGDRLSGEGVSLMAGETRTVSIMLDNEMDYTAFQMDLTLPEGLTASNFRLTDRAGSHAFDVNTLRNGSIRALCYSPALTAIGGHEGALLTFDVTATAPVAGDIAVGGIELVTTACQTVHPDAFTIGVNAATSVNEVANGKAIAKVEYFNLAGQQIDRPDSGVTLVVTTYTDGTRTTTKVIR